VVGAKILSFAVLLALLPAAPAFSEAKELPLEELIQESGFIARVEVLETGPAAAGEDRGFLSVARVRVLESFRGPPAGETVRLRFDNGLAYPNVHYARGDDCLLFAALDLDGTFSTVNDYFGKRSAGNGYRSLAAEVRRLCPRFDHRLTLRARPATDRFVDAKDLVIEVAFVNSGTEPLRFPNAVSSVLSVKGRLEYARQAAPRGVTIVCESEDGPDVMEKVLEPVLYFLDLRPGESCETSIVLSEFLPCYAGRVKLKAWALAGGRISGPVRLSVDFGEGPLLARELRKVKPGESPDRGPFRKVGPLDRLLRFAGQHALLLGFFAAALLLILLNGRRNAARS
jgi:hypothetical protein